MPENGAQRRILSFLHLSDIHFRGPRYAATRAKPDEIAGRLVEYLRNRRKAEPLDIVLVTGDVAFQAKEEEYHDATELLHGITETLGLTTSNVFVVPGNHDLEWCDPDFPRTPQPDVWPPGASECTKKLGLPIRWTPETVDSFLSDPKNRTKVLRPLVQYNRWCREFFGDERFCISPDKPYYVHRVELDSGLRVAIVGLHTSLNSYENSYEGHARNVVLGKAVLDGIKRDLQGLRPVDLVIGLGHHPLEWFAKEQEVRDSSSVSRLIDLFDFYAQGHEHEVALDPRARISPRDGFDPFYALTAGAVYQSELGTHPNLFTQVVVTLGEDAFETDRADGDLAISLHVYHSASRRFESELPSKLGLPRDEPWDIHWARGPTWYQREEETLVDWLDSLEEWTIGRGESGLRTHCQMFPPGIDRLTDLSTGKKATDHEPFEDGGEGRSLRVVVNQDLRLPPLSQQLLQELDRFDDEHGTTFRGDFRQGLNEYQRITCMPRLLDCSDPHESKLLIETGPTLYGYHLLRPLSRLYNWRPPVVTNLLRRYSLMSLGVRVALAYKRDGEYYTVLQRRAVENTKLRPGAWDVSASGYIEKRHSHDGGRTLSPALACQMEITEELGIAETKLPFQSERYLFYALYRDRVFCNADLVSVALPDVPPDMKEIRNHIAKGKRKVSEVVECRLTPEAVAKLVAEKHYWSPGAIPTLVAALRACGTDGYSFAAIETAFKQYDLANQVKFEPLFQPETGRESGP